MTVAAHARRGFLQTAAATTLNGEHNASQTTIHGSDLSTWAGVNTNGPGTYTIARGKTDEETGTFTAVSSNDLTGVTRPANAQTHSSGASLELTISKVDLDEANELVSRMASQNVRVYNSAALTIANTTFSTPTFNSERYDGNGLHSTSVNTGRLTATAAGKYLIFFALQWAGNATGQRLVGIKLNGSATIGRVVQAPAGVNSTSMCGSVVWDMALNDWVQLEVYQDSGGNLDLEAVGSFTPEFGMQWIGF